jgi:hypothetical protein
VLQLHNAVIALKLDKGSEFLAILIKDKLKLATYFYEKLSILLGDNQVNYLPNQFNMVFKRPSSYLMKKYQLMPYGEKAIACVLFNINLVEQFIGDFAAELKNNIEKN